jgi:formate dehydrogenase subunit delta
MRRALLAHIDATGGEGIEPIVQTAVARHRDKLAVAQAAA